MADSPSVLSNVIIRLNGNLDEKTSPDQVFVPLKGREPYVVNSKKGVYLKIGDYENTISSKDLRTTVSDKSEILATEGGHFYISNDTSQFKFGSFKMNPTEQLIDGTLSNVVITNSQIQQSAINNSDSSKPITAAKFVCIRGKNFGTKTEFENLKKTTNPINGQLFFLISD